MSTETLLIICLAATIFILVYGIYETTLGKKETAKDNIKQLLGTQKPSNAVEFKQQQDVALKKHKKGDETFIAKLEVKLERANLMIKPQEYLLICCFVGAFTVPIAAFMFGIPFPVAVLLGIAGGFFPMLFLNVKIMLRMKKADAEFADILDALVNCFKTGYGFSRAIQVIAENNEDPWGTEFGKMSMEMNLGSTQEDVLYSLAGRIPSADVDLFVTALIIQKETGGNLAELLGSLSATCRERYKIYRKISAISAQGKLSALVVACIPFLLMGLMSCAFPGPCTKFVSNPIGFILLVVAGIWMSIGFGFLYKITQVEV
jgi:tight adherence protein B